MLRTNLGEIIIDIECMNDYARCQLKGTGNWKTVPYSAIQWVSKNWID